MPKAGVFPENKDFVLKGKKIENGFLNIILELKDE